jgi:flagellar FliL protein
MAEQNEAAENAEGGKAPAKGEGKGKLFVILGVVFVLLGGGGAGAFFMLRESAAPDAAAKAEEEKKHEAPKGIISFEPFVVNLADAGGKRFLRINVRLLVPEEEEAKHLEDNKVAVERLRASILELLTEQTSDVIVQAEGKAALKAKIIDHATHIIEPVAVADVLFSDFVVQY